MDINIIKYRKQHKKCKWCKYYKYNSPSSKIPGISCADYETCELKDKIIYCTNLRTLCKWYKLKGGKNEI